MEHGFFVLNFPVKRNYLKHIGKTAFLEKAFTGDRFKIKEKRSYLVRKATAEYETLVSRYQGQDKSERASTSPREQKPLPHQALSRVSRLSEVGLQPLAIVRASA